MGHLRRQVLPLVEAVGQDVSSGMEQQPGRRNNFIAQRRCKTPVQALCCLPMCPHAAQSLYSLFGLPKCSASFWPTFVRQSYLSTSSALYTVPDRVSILSDADAAYSHPVEARMTHHGSS